jgi:SAM-dependent methyltransferase
LESKKDSIDNWFTDWFDSDHYHLLYQHRNDAEAEAFINRLFEKLHLEQGSKVLDLACGKGRHALQVHQLGYDVIGLDLSEESISHAKKFEEEGLRFVKGDMRQLALNEKFDLTLNLFTSFGYFREKEEDLKVLEGLSKHLKKDGMVLIDFLNVNKVANELPNSNLIKREQIEFKTSKKIEDGFIVKDIRFEDKGVSHHFREFVKYLELGDFEAYFQKVGMKIVEVYGDYFLKPFNEKLSDRLIMIAKYA